MRARICRNVGREIFKDINRRSDARTVVLRAGSVFGGARQKAAQARRRAWVSLEHQRALEAERLGLAKKAEETVPVVKKSDGETEVVQYDYRSEISADKFEHVQNSEGDLIATGNAKIEDEKFELHADKIRYSQNSGAAEASGKVKASIGQSRVVAEKFSYNPSKELLHTPHARFGSSPMFVEADSITSDKNKVSIDNPTVYVGEPSPYSMSASASQIRYDTQTELLELDDTLVSIGPVPVFYAPYYSQYGLERPPFDIQTRAGYNSDYGAFLANTVMYNGLGSLSPGMLLDYYTERSVLVGPALNYDYKGAETWLKGFFPRRVYRRPRQQGHSRSRFSRPAYRQ